MGRYELEPWLEQEVRGLLNEHGGHFDLAGRIKELRKQGIGRNIEVQSKTDRMAWYAGIILPITEEDTEHGVLLANGRVFIIKADADDAEQLKFYRDIMGSHGPLSWNLTNELDIAHVEEQFQNPGPLPFLYDRGWNSSEDPDMTDLVIGMGLEIASKR